MQEGADRFLLRRAIFEGDRCRAEQMTDVWDLRFLAQLSAMHPRGVDQRVLKFGREFHSPYANRGLQSFPKQ